MKGEFDMQSWNNSWLQSKSEVFVGTWVVPYYTWNTHEWVGKEMLYA